MAILGRKKAEEVKEAEIVKDSSRTAKPVIASAAKQSNKSEKSTGSPRRTGSARDDKKRDAKKAETAAKAKLTVRDLRELSEKDLFAKLAETRGDLNDFHKMARANELPSSHVIKKTRKEIARIHTILTEKKFAKLAEGGEE